MGQKRADKVRRRKERQLNGQKARDRAQEFMERQEARRKEELREAELKAKQEARADELYKRAAQVHEEQRRQAQRTSLFNEEQRKAILVDPTMIHQSVKPEPPKPEPTASAGVVLKPRRPYMPRGFIGMSSILAMCLMSGMTGVVSSKESK